MTEERKLLILGLLRMTEMHGYVLNAHIDSVSPITLKKPAAYNLLDSMERDGWIEHREESTGDRHRKVFSVTTAGEDAFFELLRTQVGAYTPNESPGMVGLSFSTCFHATMPWISFTRDVYQFLITAGPFHRMAMWRAEIRTPAACNCPSSMRGAWRTWI